jgi:hypothetical protein
MADSGLLASALARAARDDYPAWLAQATTVGGCSRPVRLHGQVHDVDPATGEVLRTSSTDEAPDGVIYTACGDRRASVCPACAETYRADTYQLLRAGLAGGKGVPESVAAHPCVFATFTAPSFGHVHARITSPAGQVLRCRPRRKHTICPHGRSLSCPQRHRETDACLGKPLCPDCYDYPGAVVWNAHAPELWRRTTIALRRRLDKLARDRGTRLKVSYAKVAEFQGRGLVHFHGIIRLDGLDPADPTRVIAPPPGFSAQLLTAAIQAVVKSIWFATVPHPARPNGWDICWGSQLDIRTVRMSDTGEITDTAVASYLAKYATKSIEAVGPVAVRINPGNLHAYASPVHPPRTADPRRVAAGPPSARGLPGIAAVGAHARLPRPLRHQESPLLHHPARPAHRPGNLAPPPAPPRRPPRGNRSHRRHPVLLRNRVAHHRRRTPGPVGRHPRPRAPAHRP